MDTNEQRLDPHRVLAAVDLLRKKGTALDVSAPDSEPEGATVEELHAALLLLSGKVRVIWED